MSSPAARLPIRFGALSLVAAASSLAPIDSRGPQAYAASRAPARWVNISPAGVSTDPNASHGQNYGFQAIAVDPKSGTLYVGTCYQGLWKSTNRGKTWSKVNTGTNGALLDSGRIWALAIDPVNPQLLYATAGYGAGGILKSIDGGVSWTNLIPSDSSLEKTLRSEDIYSIAVDPANHNHILASFHGYFSGGTYANRSPILESLDGGGSWTLRTIGPLSYPQYVYFLGNSATWLVGTTVKGFWRTMDSGRHWTQVSRQSFSDGGSELYRARNGTWYVAAAGSLLQSTNGGRTWKSVGPPGSSPYMGLVGDGARLYTQPADTGGDRSKRQHYYTSAETNGTHWKQMGSQTFFDGPVDMTYDSGRHIVYSSNWRAGVWKLRVTPDSKKTL